VTEFILLIFALALLLYALFAGADFGAGMVELLAKRTHRAAEERGVGQASRPRWSAYHEKKILALVILFTAFPTAFSEISTVFHIPLTLMLVGIIFRGCAFTFRHYDPFEDESRKFYSLTFIISSFITPFSQGLVVGGCMLGAIPANKASFAATYILPWFNIFCFSVSIFVCALFFFLAAVFLVGETKDLALRADFVKRARLGVFLSTLSAIGVFVAAEFVNFPLWNLFSSHVSVFAIPLTLLSIALLWLALKHGRVMIARVLAGVAVGSILLGWFGINYPYIIGGHSTAQMSLNLYDVVAPNNTLTQLTIALVVGAVIIFPSLFYLLKTFKAEVGSGD